jgi:hypothetical protein
VFVFGSKLLSSPKLRFKCLKIKVNSGYKAYIFKLGLQISVLVSVQRPLNQSKYCSHIGSSFIQVLTKKKNSVELNNFELLNSIVLLTLRFSSSPVFALTSRTNFQFLYCNTGCKLTVEYFCNPIVPATR